MNNTFLTVAKEPLLTRLLADLKYNKINIILGLMSLTAILFIYKVFALIGNELN